MHFNCYLCSLYYHLKLEPPMVKQLLDLYNVSGFYIFEANLSEQLRYDSSNLPYVHLDRILPWMDTVRSSILF